MRTAALFSKRIVVALALSALAACAYRGGDIGDPVTRKFHWYSFIEGEDIRTHCAPGTPDRYRLVYNGIYQEQLRIYELDSVRRLLVAHVTGDGDVSRIDPSDLLAQWRVAEARVQLSDDTYRSVVESLAQSGTFAPPPVGLSLPARSYFWTAAYCRDGRYGFTAWAHPSPRFDAITFDRVLFGLDTTGVPVNAPKPVRFDPQFEDRAKRGEVTDFTLRVGANGLVR